MLVSKFSEAKKGSENDHYYPKPPFLGDDDMISSIEQLNHSEGAEGCDVKEEEEEGEEDKVAYKAEKTLES